MGPPTSRSPLRRVYVSRGVFCVVSAELRRAKAAVAVIALMLIRDHMILAIFRDSRYSERTLDADDRIGYGFY